MRLSVKTIATAAFAVLLLPAFNLFGSEAAIVPTSAANSDPTSAVAIDAVVVAPEPAMQADSATTAMPRSGGVDRYYPRTELFMGYTYLRSVPSLDAGNRLVWLNGGSTSLAFNFNRYFGLVGDFGGFNETRLLLQTGIPPTALGAYSAVQAGTVFTYLGGPRLSFRKYNRVTPFAQVLFGGIRASQESICQACAPSLPTQSSFAMTAGGGLDVRLHHHLAIRVIQAEYMMTRFENLSTGSTQAQNDIRLSTGIVLRFGGAPRGPAPLPLAYSCVVNPSSVFAGEAITVTGSALNLNPEKAAVYTWSSNGGTVAGVSNTASINTGSLAAGSYTVKGHVSEGDKPDDNADCVAGFVVKALEPPTVSCTADPSTVRPGDPSTITAIGVSPEDSPLTYSYSSTSGSVSGTGNTATLTTNGAAAGAIGVTCKVVDDKGQAAQSDTTVTIVVPAAPAKPAVSEMCAVSFARDARRPARVDNEAKACLDQLALNLQSNADGKLALVWNAGSREKGGTKLAMERAVNTKAYLVSEKGIDSARISVYSGSADGKVVSTFIIPAGATFDTTGTTPAQ